jgi:hypothetical protein
MHIIRAFQLLSCLIITTAYALPLTERDAATDANTKQCPDYCAGTQTNQSLIHVYVCGDARLGPKRLPTHLPLDSLLDIYDRFGGLCPGQFLAKWFNSTSGYYNYPPDNGFQLNTASAPIEGTIAFPVGFLMDRFGSEYGSFVSPASAPYMQRALPPSNLDTPASDPRSVSLFKSMIVSDLLNRYPYNYHVYRVLQPFNALSGPIAAWFGQPGQGVQYQLATNIIGLINGGFIEEVDLSSY